MSAMTVFGHRFVVGDKPGMHTAPLKEDVDGMAAVVRNASKVADYTIVYSHNHEGGDERYYPAEFFVTFAHAMIDAGADVVTASGPHVLARDRALQGQADSLRSRRFHLRERNAPSAAAGELRAAAHDAGLRRRSRRFQRAPIEQRHHQLPCRSARLGIIHRDAAIRRQEARRAEALSDLARVQEATSGSRLADVARRRSSARRSSTMWRPSPRHSGRRSTSRTESGSSASAPHRPISRPAGIRRLS